MTNQSDNLNHGSTLGGSSPEKRKGQLEENTLYRLTNVRKFYALKPPYKITRFTLSGLKSVTELSYREKDPQEKEMIRKVFTILRKLQNKNLLKIRNILDGVSESYRFEEEEKDDLASLLCDAGRFELTLPGRQEELFKLLRLSKSNLSQSDTLTALNTLSEPQTKQLHEKINAWIQESEYPDTASIRRSLRAFLGAKHFETYGKTIESHIVKKQVLYIKDLTIPVGQTVAIIGESGSGKSTLIDLLGAIDDHDSGRIAYQFDPDEASDGQTQKINVNQHCHYIFQKSHSLPTLNNLDNISIANEIKTGQPKEDCDILTKRLMKTLNIQGLEHQLPNQISIGQAQRTEIARALSVNPEVMFADEPTGSLDPKSKWIVWNTLLTWKGLNPEKNLFIITHDIQFLLKKIQYVILVNKGRVYHKIIDLQSERGRVVRNHLDRRDNGTITSDVGALEQSAVQTNGTEFASGKKLEHMVRETQSFHSKQTEQNFRFSHFLWMFILKDLFSPIFHTRSKLKKLKTSILPTTHNGIVFLVIIMIAGGLSLYHTLGPGFIDWLEGNFYQNPVTRLLRVDISYIDTFSETETSAQNSDQEKKRFSNLSRRYTQKDIDKIKQLRLKNGQPIIVGGKNHAPIFPYNYAPAQIYSSSRKKLAFTHKIGVVPKRLFESLRNSKEQALEFDDIDMIFTPSGLFTLTQGGKNKLPEDMKVYFYINGSQKTFYLKEAPDIAILNTFDVLITEERYIEIFENRSGFKSDRKKREYSGLYIILDNLNDYYEAKQVLRQNGWNAGSPLRDAIQVVLKSRNRIDTVGIVILLTLLATFVISFVWMTNNMLWRKIKDIGFLLSLGLNKRQIGGLYLAENVVIIVIGYLWGAWLFLAIWWGGARIGFVISDSLSAGSFLMSFLLTIAILVIITVLVLIKILNIPPSKAIRYEGT